jgi:hypothetical protein
VEYTNEGTIPEINLNRVLEKMYISHRIILPSSADRRIMLPDLEESEFRVNELKNNIEKSKNITETAQEKE